jgi:hypothetical protein
MRRTPGTASIRISRRLPSRSPERTLKPVMLPPGLASDATKPALTKSDPLAGIGMVLVACCAALTFTSPPAENNCNVVKMVQLTRALSIH